MDNPPDIIVHMDIELKNRAGAVWFWQAAAEISFSFYIRDNLFIPHIEAIRYVDRHSKAVILPGNEPYARDALRFQFLAGELERRRSFTAAALAAAQAQAARRRAQFAAISGEACSYPSALAGLRLP